MAYTVELSRGAKRDLAALESIVAQRVRDVFEILRGNARPHGYAKLAGERDLYRMRAGSYRVIYQIDDRIHRVLVITVQHRREVYR